MRSHTTLLVLITIAQLAVAPLLAQGPKPLGLRQPAPTVAAPARRSGEAGSADTAHVKPNHWKGGARIGLAAGALPIAVLAATTGCEKPGLDCAVLKSMYVVSGGFLGALAGSFVGSFFPRRTTGQ